MKRIPGFTLVELLATLMIIAVLMGLGLFGMNRVQLAGRDGSRQAKLAEIKTAVDFFYRINSRYPATSAVNWTNNQTLVIGTRTVRVTGHLTRSTASRTNLTQTYYYYNLETDGYRLCVKQENGNWYQLSTSTLSCNGL